MTLTPHWQAIVHWMICLSSGLWRTAEAALALDGADSYCGVAAGRGRATQSQPWMFSSS